MSENENPLIKIFGPIAQTTCTLAENLLGEPCKVAGVMLSDQVYHWQWKNRIRIFNRAKEILDKNGVAARLLPAGFFIPLVEAAGNVDEPSLQEMWANLLASSVNNEAYRTARFVKVLSELSKDEAVILSARGSDEYVEKHEIAQEGRGSLFAQFVTHVDLRHYLAAGTLASMERPGDAIEYLEHLILLGILGWKLKREPREPKDPVSRLWGGSSARVSVATRTNFGNDFVAACIPEPREGA